MFGTGTDTLFPGVRLRLGPAHYLNIRYHNPPLAYYLVKGWVLWTTHPRGSEIWGTLGTEGRWQRPDE